MAHFMRFRSRSLGEIGVRMADGKLFPIFDWQRALLDSKLPKETKTVGWALSTFTNKHGGNAHPGETLLAEKLDPTTTRTIRTHLMRLRAEGFISRVMRGSVAENRRWADMYQLTFPDETTGNELPEVDDGHRKPVSGDVWGPWPDHRKSGTRPPETEHTDHRKLISAQQPIASTNTLKAAAPSGAAPRTCARGVDDPLCYDDPDFEDEERREIVVAELGGMLGPGDEPAIDSMILKGYSLQRIVNAINAKHPLT